MCKHFSTNKLAIIKHCCIRIKEGAYILANITMSKHHVIEYYPQCQNVASSKRINGASTVYIRNSSTETYHQPAVLKAPSHMLISGNAVFHVCTEQRGNLSTAKPKKR